MSARAAGWFATVTPMYEGNHLVIVQDEESIVTTIATDWGKRDEIMFRMYDHESPGHDYDEPDLKLIPDTKGTA